MHIPPAATLRLVVSRPEQPTYTSTPLHFSRRTTHLPLTHAPPHRQPWEDDAMEAMAKAPAARSAGEDREEDSSNSRTATAADEEAHRGTTTTEDSKGTRPGTTTTEETRAGTAADGRTTATEEAASSHSRMEASTQPSRTSSTSSRPATAATPHSKAGGSATAEEARARQACPGGQPRC
jgi:hypothetical protein